MNTYVDERTYVCTYAHTYFFIFEFSDLGIFGFSDFRISGFLDCCIVLCFEAFCFQFVTNLCNTFCQFDLEYLQSLSLMLVESQVSLVTAAGLNGSVLI